MFVWFLLVILVSVYYLKITKKSSGPWGLPIIGYVPFLTQQPCERLLTLSKKYGPVYPLNIWGRTYFILNSFRSVKEALSDTAIEDRAHDFSYLSESFQHNSMGAFNGTKWRTHRKFVMAVLMGQSAVSDNCQIFLDVAEDLTSFIRSTNGSPTDYREPLSKTTTNAITCVMYSKRYQWHDEELSYITSKVRYLLHELQGMEFLYAGPIFECFMNIVHRRRHQSIIAASKECTDLFQKMAEKRFQDGGRAEGRDFFDHFLSNHRRELENNVSEKEISFTIESLASTTFNLVLAAADTSSETIYWAFYFLAKYPVVQEKVQRELDDVIGSRAIAMADRTRLPYTLAFIEETQRVACLLPTGITREVVASTEICGTNIPKGSYVVPNLHACMSDETYFKHSAIFDPSRFINGEGKFVSIEANSEIHDYLFNNFDFILE
ncbi:Cytochrome P450 2A9 [Halotydeus destructor]|nr:Cytochrome P450 2A9 [Halotydeus destructor]